MHSLGKLAVILGVTCLAAPAIYGVEVRVDFDSSVNFSAFSTFSFMDGTLAEDLEVEARIHAAIERELIPLGLREVREDPDLYIVTHASLEPEKWIETVDYDYWVGYEGFKKPIEAAVETWGGEAGMLLVDILEASSQRLIWRGLATGNVAKTSEKRDRKLDKTMAQLFGDFPPKYKNKSKASDGD